VVKIVQKKILTAYWENRIEHAVCCLPRRHRTRKTNIAPSSFRDLQVQSCRNFVWILEI